MQKTSEKKEHTIQIRLGGLTIIVGFAIHVIINSVLKEFPPEDPTASELQVYLSNEASTWAIVHGLRYAAFTCIVLFSAGLFSRTCCTRSARTAGWSTVVLLGAAIFVTNGVITNGIELLAFLIPTLFQHNKISSGCSSGLLECCLLLKL